MCETCTTKTMSRCTNHSYPIKCFSEEVINRLGGYTFLPNSDLHISAVCEKDIVILIQSVVVNPTLQMFSQRWR